MGCHGDLGRDLPQAGVIPVGPVNLPGVSVTAQVHLDGSEEGRRCTSGVGPVTDPALLDRLHGVPSRAVTENVQRAGPAALILCRSWRCWHWLRMRIRSRVLGGWRAAGLLALSAGLLPVACWCLYEELAEGVQPWLNELMLLLSGPVSGGWPLA